MPYPGRGHINPLLNLAGHLSTRGLFVTVVLTEEWLGLLSTSPTPSHPAVQFRSIPNVIPSEHGRANDFNGFLDAINTKLEKPFERLLESLDPPPAAILADTCLSWMAAVGERRRLPVYSLWTMPAAFFSLFYGFEDIFGGESTAALEEIDKKLEQHVKGLNLGDVSSVICSATLKKWVLESFIWARGAKGVIFTSVYELESDIIDSLKSKLSCPVYTVGPCIPYLTLKISLASDYMQWLDSQPINSVLYLSLGSFLSVSVAQMDEIVTGLHESGIRFLVVGRGATSRVQAKLGSTDLVVQWCDQLKVLCHPSIGGFFTHCGWNSTMECVFAGKPMLTFPLFGDQPLNCKLIANVWKVGLNVKEEIEDGNLVGGKAIAKVAKRLMDVEGIEYKEMREKVVELSETVHRAVEEGGSSYCAINAFVEDVSSSV
ncbi:LOW QUALITY PROTEIN: UDP-glycosyltransferase 87A2-like [Dioscorea cayenensis subsp. rotundata]|uniref:LOW QUALITY PROTEIN: UDP-glycosyltransferase 87A2-like n=1 Tax=Dioscorea cayennensis subsp. rotundata TaxID=55577 RepID=A0AB40CCY8_DIOCR|nr:LOW QUALITY PROTEIN: UDP-glycosyltransferase 87A2-like [Dioscorea cayenensis subsp. rotundata]